MLTQKISSIKFSLRFDSGFNEKVLSVWILEIIKVLKIHIWMTILGNFCILRFIF